MNSIFVVTVTLVFYTIGVESSCQNFSNNQHFRGDNIVFNRNVSHTPATYIDDRFKASLAADGKCNTNFRIDPPYTCSMTDKNNVSSPTWTVTFDKSYQITGIVIYNRDDEIHRKRLGNFTVFGECNGTEKVILYNDAGENKYQQKIIQIEITDTHVCSTISIQIPQSSVSGHVQYLTLCEVQVYTAVCRKPTDQLISNISPDKQFYNKNESLTFECKRGYRPSLSNTSVSCCGIDTFCPSPVCERVYCQLPNQPDNGKYLRTSTNTSLEYETNITGVCDIGYKTEILDTKRTCQQNGTWSGQDLVCTQIVCTPPAKVQHGNYTYTNNGEYNYINETYNTNLTGHCILGYKLTNPSSTISCGLNESWIGNVPICNIVTCDPPVAIQYGYYRYANNTNYTQTTEEYNTTLLGECNIGYKLSSPSPNERRCSQYGNWSERLAVCEPITCPWPVLENGNYTGKKGPFYYNDQLTPICDEGYRLSNNDTIVCDENGRFNDTATCVLLENESDSQVGSSNIGMIVGVVAAIVTCVALVVIVFIIFMRRRNSNGDKSRETKTMNNAVGGEYANVQETRFANAGTTGASKAQGIYENSALNVQQDAEGTPAVNDDSANAYYSFQGDDSVPLTAIKLENLSDIVLKGDRAQAQFKEQFESLPFGMTEPFVVARQEDNIGKNRYKNLFAYDHSRVVLQKDRPDQSDYINACYVDGYSRPNAYIASQGPTKTTLGDFWRMIWQSDCNKIVMLTNLIEEGKTKCVRYWPEDKEEVFDNIIVKLEKTESFSEFVVRSMSMTKNDMGTKKVTQFHFTAWPDKGVPKYASSLVQFRHKVTYAQPARNNPIIVHCSAGIGRTGTFVALDFLTEQAKEMGYVDVFGAVKAMRKQRVNFVQTLEQYTFLHHALVETLMLSTSALPSSKFPQWYKSILQFDQSKKKRKINVEFETLSRLSPTADEWQYTNAKQPNNRTKNRYSNILPMQEFMPRLDQLDDTNSDTTYINAVFLPSYKQKDAFIVTQTPLVETKDDFWRLVWEHDIHVIVMMNNMDETTEEEQYWPNDDCTVTSGNLVIAHKTTKHEKYCKTVKMQVQNKLVTRSIVQVQFGGWKTYEKLPDSKDSILSLFETIQSLQRTVGNQPLLVHCMNGVDKSGLYCVISAVLERMKIEQDVAITQVIEEMRKAREQIIPSIEQFEFCHQVVLAYIEEYSTYSNFTL